MAAMRVTIWYQSKAGGENMEVFYSCDLEAYLSYGSTSNQVKPDEVEPRGTHGEYECAFGYEVS